MAAVQIIKISTQGVAAFHLQPQAGAQQTENSSIWTAANRQKRAAAQSLLPFPSHQRPKSDHDNKSDDRQHDLVQ